MNRKISKATKHDVVRRFRAGHYPKNIASFLGVSLTSVSRWVKRYRNVPTSRLRPAPSNFTSVVPATIASPIGNVSFLVDPRPTTEEIGRATVNFFLAMKDLARLLPQ